MEEVVKHTKKESVAFANYLSGIFAWMFAGLTLSGIVGYLIAAAGDSVKAIFYNPIALIGLVILQLGLVIFLSARIMKLSASAARGSSAAAFGHARRGRRPPALPQRRRSSCQAQAKQGRAHQAPVGVDRHADHREGSHVERHG